MAVIEKTHAAIDTMTYGRPFRVSFEILRLASKLLGMLSFYDMGPIMGRQRATDVMLQFIENFESYATKHSETIISEFHTLPNPVEFMLQIESRVSAMLALMKYARKNASVQKRVLSALSNLCSKDNPFIPTMMKKTGCLVEIIDTMNWYEDEEDTTVHDLAHEVLQTYLSFDDELQDMTKNINDID
jgi:hypothetical protein